MRRKCKIAGITLLHELNAFVLKLQQKILHGEKSIVSKTALVPQYLLTRMLSIIFSLDFFANFSKCDGGFHAI